MASLTPQHGPHAASLFSPVRVSDAASTASPLGCKTPDSLGLRQRIKTICKTLLENHTKWLAVQRRGTALCAQIEACKKRALDELQQQTNAADDAKSSSSSSNTNGGVYPDELRAPCAKFKVILTILDDVLSAAGDAERQLLAIQRLQAPPATDKPVFKTWPISRFVQCAAELRAAYALELPVRRKCMQEIAHARSTEELLLHCCVWDYPVHVSEDRWAVAVLSLRHECDIDEAAAVPQSPVVTATPAAGKKHK